MQPIAQAPPAPAPVVEKAPKPQAKNDPKMIAAARELRDRWLEKVNSGEHIPQIVAKYDVRRSVGGTVSPALASPRRLEAA
jgi:hypothetical protein